MVDEKNDNSGVNNNNKGNNDVFVSNDDIYLAPPLEALLIKYFVVVTETIYRETSDENVCKPVKKGIYTFTSKKAQNRFTTVCNRDIDNVIAFQLDNIKHKEKTK